MGTRSFERYCGAKEAVACVNWPPFQDTQFRAPGETSTYDVVKKTNAPGIVYPIREHPTATEKR